MLSKSTLIVPLPKDAYIKLSFLNEQGVAVFSHTSDKAFSFDSFGTDYAQFEMKLPTNLASGTYQTKGGSSCSMDFSPK